MKRRKPERRALTTATSNDVVKRRDNIQDFIFCRALASCAFWIFLSVNSLTDTHKLLRSSLPAASLQFRGSIFKLTDRFKLLVNYQRIQLPFVDTKRHKIVHANDVVCETLTDLLHVWKQNQIHGEKNSQ